MDYYSITTSDIEWRAAICLCGSTSCRGSFLHYATQDDLQQVLNQNCGPLWRYASLLRACSGIPLTPDYVNVLNRHGMKSSALGWNPPHWVQKYVADNLRFVEYERKALPCALLRSKGGTASLYSYSSADMDARSVMEQRIQSMVCCFSMVDQVLMKQSDDLKSRFPLIVYQSNQVVDKIWNKMRAIPDMISKSLLNPAIEFISKSKQLQNPTDEVDIRTTSPSGESQLLDKETESHLDASDKILQKSSTIKKLQNAVDEMRQLLNETPSNLAAVKSGCLSLRNILLPLEDLSNSKARYFIKAIHNLFIYIFLIIIIKVGTSN